VKFLAPTCPDEALTVLVNDSGAYKLMLTGVIGLAEGNKNYETLRFHIYHACKAAFDAYGAARQALTSRLIPRICEHYWYEASGLEWSEKDARALYDITPDWAKAQLDRKPKEPAMAASKTPTFKVGDKVRIINKPYNPSPAFASSGAMDSYVGDGRIYTVAYTEHNEIRLEEARYGTNNEDYWYWDPRCLELANDSTSTQVTQSEKEITVANPKAPIEHITFIYGVERKDVTDDQIFEHIRNLENQIKDLEKIDNKPKKLKDKIKSLKNNIDDLIKLVDGDTVSE
jgi:hypothetical protein